MYFLLLLLSSLLLSACGNSLTSYVSPKSRQPTPSPTTYYPSPTPTTTPQVVLGLGGDVGLGRNITFTARRLNDFNYSFAQVSPWLDQNDLNFVNLESPIVSSCPSVKTGTFKFCGDPQFLPYLKQHKFFFNLANNHIQNYGNTGVEQTKLYLDQHIIGHVYSEDPENEFEVRTYNGIRLGFLGFDLVTNNTPEAKTSILNLIKKYDSQVDWLIVALHWGNEYYPDPEPWKVKFAHQLINSGADIIAGHHPHVWQGQETYQNKLIFYSLGNFVFDQNWSKPTSQSYLIRLTLGKDSIINQENSPFEIQNNSQPVFIDRLSGYPFKLKDIL